MSRHEFYRSTGESRGKTSAADEPPDDDRAGTPTVQVDRRSHEFDVVESSDASPLLSVVIPAYNEAASVAETVTHVLSIVGDVTDSHEVIVVDDGSDDETAVRLRALADQLPAVECVCYEQNRGKGHAIKRGCESATGELVLFLDADGDLTPERIAAFVDQLATTGADLVIGSKRHPDSEVSYPLKRRVLSKGYSLAIRGLFGLEVTDTQVGMKLLRREVVDEVLPLVLVQRYAFDLELLALAHDRGYEVAEAPVSLDFNGASNIRWRDVGRIGIDTVRVFSRLNFLRSYDLIERAVLRYDRACEPRPSADRIDE